MPDQPDIDIIPVTDHALVRYFERVEGRDIEKIKAEINNPQLLQWYAELGDGGKYPVDNRYYVVIDDRVVKTVLPI